MRVTLEVGGLRFRVASTGEEIDRRLRAALAAYVREDDLNAPEAYIVSAPPNGRGLFTLHRFDCLVLRARSAGRLLDGLRRNIAADVGWHPDGLVPIRAVCLRTADGLAVLPDRLRRRIVPHARRMADAGVAVLDDPIVGIDPGTGELVVAEVPLAVPAEAAADFAALGGTEPAQLGGRYRLRAVYVPSRAGVEDVAAVRALHLLGGLTDGAPEPGRVLDAALAAVEPAHGLQLPSGGVADPDALLGRLR